MSELLLPNSSIGNGRYSLVKFIGRGGCSFVYEGKDRYNNSVAIKEVFDRGRCRRIQGGEGLIPKKDVKNAERIHLRQLQRAKEEYQRFHDIEHPNLIVPSDIVEDNNTIYLILPLLNGPDLQEKAEGQSFNGVQIVTLITPVLRAVDLLHKMGVIHRDLKPDNIKLQIINGQETPVLIDTGAARTYGSDQLHTGILTPCGAPEIYSKIEARIFGEPGPWTDTFALTGIIFFLLTGLYPLDYTPRCAEINKGKADSLGKPEHLSDDAWSFLKKGLSLHAKDRYQSIETFGIAMQKGLTSNHNNQNKVGSFKSTKEHKIEKNEGHILEWLISIILTFTISGVIALVFHNGSIYALLFLIIQFFVAIITKLNQPQRNTPSSLIPIYNLYIMSKSFFKKDGK